MDVIDAKPQAYFFQAAVGDPGSHGESAGDGAGRVLRVRCRISELV
jgi:hypothetical protein